LAATKIEASNIATGAVPSTGFTSVQSFTSSGTYTVPTAITKILVHVTGGGGGGGCTSGAYGATGGNAGGTVIKLLSVSAGDTATVVIGAGGAAQTSSPATGNNGSDSTFTSDTAAFTALTGPKGVGGGMNASTVAAALPTGGDMNISGGPGNNYGGGTSVFGGGGPSAWATANVSRAALGYGGGGGSGSSNTSYHDGAAGMSGVCFVMEYK